MAAVKRVSAGYIFWSFDIVFILSHFDYRVLLKPVLAGVTSVVHFITDHEPTQLKRVLWFRVFGESLAFKASNYLELNLKKIFRTYETEFVLFLAVLESPVLPMG